MILFAHGAKEVEEQDKFENDHERIYIAFKAMDLLPLMKTDKIWPVYKDVSATITHGILLLSSLSFTTNPFFGFPLLSSSSFHSTIA